MAIQDSINQAIGTIGGSAAGLKHIANQNEQKAISSLGQLETATNQLNLKESQQADLEQSVKKFDLENPDFEVDVIQNAGQISKLEGELDKIDQSYNDPHPRGEGGRFISKEEHKQNLDKRTDELWDELSAAKKAQKTYQTKWTAKQNMLSDIEKKKSEVQLATSVKQQAEANFEKQKKYLPKGGKK